MFLNYRQTCTYGFSLDCELVALLEDDSGMEVTKTHNFCFELLLCRVGTNKFLLALQVAG